MVFIRLLCGCGVTRFNNSDGNRGNNPTTFSTSQFKCCSVLIGAQKYSTQHHIFSTGLSRLDFMRYTIV